VEIWAAGILDRTHLRFYTWESIQELLHEAGVQGEIVEPVLTVTDPSMEILLKAVAEAGGNVDQARLELQTYQFVFRARLQPQPSDPARRRRQRWFRLSS